MQTMQTMQKPLWILTVSLLAILMASAANSGVIHDYGNFFEKANDHAIDNYNEHFTPAADHWSKSRGFRSERTTANVRVDSYQPKTLDSLAPKGLQQTYDHTETASVPGPGTFATLATGLLALGLIRRRHT